MQANRMSLICVKSWVEGGMSFKNAFKFLMWNCVGIQTLSSAVIICGSRGGAVVRALALGPGVICALSLLLYMSIYICMFQHSAKSLFGLWLFLLRWPHTVSLFRYITAKLATSAGENRAATTPGTTSPTLIE